MSNKMCGMFCMGVNAGLWEIMWWWAENRKNVVFEKNVENIIDKKQNKYWCTECCRLYKIAQKKYKKKVVYET